MEDKGKADKFEVKLQNFRVNKDIGRIQNESRKFTKRNLVVRSISLKKQREIESLNLRMKKRTE